MNITKVGLSPSVFTETSPAIATTAVWYPTAGVIIRLAKGSVPAKLHGWVDARPVVAADGTTILLRGDPTVLWGPMPMTDGATIGFKNIDIVDRTVTIYGERWM